MKQLKSSFHDLHHIFKSSITAREIAEPLFSLAGTMDSEDARSLMEKQGYHVVGIRIDGEIAGYVKKDDLTQGKAADHLRPFKPSDLLSASDSLLDTFDALKESRWVCIHLLGVPSGIITRGDLQKAPVRMWLFGLITLLEMQLLRCIQQTFKDESDWFGLITENRLHEARSIFAARRERQEEISLADCLQLADKFTIFKKTPSLLSMTGCSSKKEWKKMTSRIEPLRNNLAHANPLEIEAWPEIAAQVTWIEKVLACLENSEPINPV